MTDDSDGIDNDDINGSVDQEEKKSGEEHDLEVNENMKESHSSDGDHRDSDGSDHNISNGNHDKKDIEYDGAGESDDEESVDNDNDGSSDESSEEDESSSEEEEVSDEDESEAANQKDHVAPPVVSEDGHVLSEYEMMRLERIKRNREHLERLGLAKKNPSNNNKSTTLLAPLLAQQKQKQKRERKPITVEPDQRRSSSRSRKSISYKEQPLRAVLGDALLPLSKGEKKKAPSNGKTSQSTLNKRMDLQIYREFVRVGAQRRENLKIGKQLLRKAQMEVKHAQKKAAKFEKQKRNLLEIEKIKVDLANEKEHIGCTIREMLDHFDKRKYLMMGAKEHFEQTQKAEENEANMKHFREEAELKMQMIDALDRFPLAIKEAQNTLDMLLVERLPEDPPLPRTSGKKRKRASSAPAPAVSTAQSIAALSSPSSPKPDKSETDTKPSSSDTDNDKEQQQSQEIETCQQKEQLESSKPLSEDGLNDDPTTLPVEATTAASRNIDDGDETQETITTKLVPFKVSFDARGRPVKVRIRAGISLLDEAKAVATKESKIDANSQKSSAEDVAINATQSSNESSSTTAAKRTVGRPKKEFSIRNVGGWISPDFAKSIDRSWLERDIAPSSSFDPKTFVPQVGDIVLYYPAGHQQFLKAHPDVIGSRSKNKMMLPLWAKALRERNKLRADEKKKEQGPNQTTNTNDNEDEEEDSRPPPVSQSQSTTKDVTGDDKTKYWWTDEWLSAIHGDLGKWPLLCRIEKTHAEFPQDPSRDKRTVTKEEGVVQISWEAPEEKEKNTDKNIEQKKSNANGGAKKNLGKKGGTNKSKTNDKAKNKSKEKTKTKKNLNKKGGTNKSKTNDKAKNKSKEKTKMKMKTKTNSNDDKWRKELMKKSKKKKSRRPQLCLVVQLRPLTGLTPPGWLGNDDEDELLSKKLLNSPPPPSFNVVTFPSKAGPFLVPFSWAYRISQSFSVGDIVQPRSEKSQEGTIVEFTSGKSFGSPLLSEKIDDLTKLFGDIFGKKKPLLSILQKVFAQQQKSVSPDICSVALVMMRCLQENEQVASLVTMLETTSELQNHQGNLLLEKRLRDIILNTLPIWKCIKVQTEEGKFKKKVGYSCWDLVEPEKAGMITTLEEGPPSFLQAFSELQGMVTNMNGPQNSLEEALRAKIEWTLDKYIEEKAECDPFYYPIREKDVPTYYCAIPVGMWLGRIFKRLRINPGNDGECYYRSIDALLSDLQDIGCNCALYNAPDSEIMKGALAALPGLKAEVSRVTLSHQREKETRRKVDEERRKLVLLQCSVHTKDGRKSGDGKKKGRKRMGDSPFFGPFTESLARGWIDTIESDRCWELPNGESESVDNLEQSKWVPQCGDKIFYNRTFHEKFIKSHYQSLRIDQCKLPDLNNNTSTFGMSTDKEWKRGKVVWVRAAFPSRGSIVEGDGNICFGIATPLLSVGIQLEMDCSSSPVNEIFWRPCSVESKKDQASVPIPSTRTRGRSKKATESVRENAPLCQCCGVDLRTSFLMPSWSHYQKKLLDSVNVSDSSENPCGIETSLFVSIDRCFSMLKRRCLCEISADYVDPKFCLENVKQGVYPVSSSKSKLPSYEAFFESGAERVTGGQIIPRTRGRQSTRESSVKLLAETCFLPSWVSDEVESETDNGGSSKVAQHEMFSPNSKLCLEMIQLRLQNDYYRSTAALVHDIQEAYVSSVILAFMIARKSTQKGKSAVSLKKLARSYLLENGRSEQDEASKAIRIPASPKSKSKKKKGNNQITPKPNKKNTKIKLKPEERTYKIAMDNVRKLYATALACVLDTRVLEKVFGLSSKPKMPHKIPNAPKVITEEEKEIQTIHEKISVILNSLGRDRCNDRLRPPSSVQILPQITIKVKCNGRVVKPLKNSSETFDQTNETVHDAIALSVPAEGDCCLPKLSITEYDSNPLLSQILFGRPNMMNACGRCLAFKRNLPYCRIVKHHSNPDFDWIGFFQGAPMFKGTGGVDQMILRLHPESQLKLYVEPATLIPVNSNKSGMSTNDEAESEHTAIPKSPTVAVAAEVPVNVETGPSPSEVLELANSALLMAHSRLESATIESQKPVRMSDEFVKSYFRADEDGHYYFCYVCGLIGDVLCCESCPNVAHAGCVNLSTVPEGDWFCEKCTMKKKAVEDEKEDNEEIDSTACQLNGSKESMDDSEDEENTGKTLEEMLEELRSLREKPLVKADETPVDTDPKSSIKIGSVLVKEFEEFGEFKGTVIELPAEDGDYYRVRYEDGDEEEMSIGELEPLISLDNDSDERKGQGSSTSKDASNNKTKTNRSKSSKVAGRRAKSPAKRQSSEKPAPKRGRGRPRKIQIEDESEQAPKSSKVAGRHTKSPAKNQSSEKPTPKRGRGRPRKMKPGDEAPKPSKVAGRRPKSPAKKESPEKPTPKRGRGRPRKVESEQDPIRRGRPRKRPIKDIVQTKNISDQEESSDHFRGTAKRPRINNSVPSKKAEPEQKNKFTETRKRRVQGSDSTRERGSDTPIQSPSRYGRNRKKTSRWVDQI